MKSLCIYFGYHSLLFLNSFLNILDECNVLILNKYYALSINLILQNVWKPRADEMVVEDRGAEGRGTQAPYLKRLNGI